MSSKKLSQIEILITEATENVAVNGRDAEFQDLLLASIGYLSHEINRPQWWSIKRVLPIAFAAGSAFGAGVLSVVSKVLFHL